MENDPKKGMPKAGTLQSVMFDQDVKPLIDERAASLMAEFKTHLEHVKQVVENADEGRVYQAWSMQKIAGLQIVLENLAMRLTLMEEI